VRLLHGHHTEIRSSRHHRRDDVHARPLLQGDAHGRVQREKARQIGRQVAADGVVVGKQRDVRLDAPGIGQQVRMHLLELCQAAAHVFEHHRSGSRELHSAGAAQEQRRTNGVLERLEPQAHR
jgi:hypothetical protein